MRRLLDGDPDVPRLRSCAALCALHSVVARSWLPARDFAPWLEALRLALDGLQQGLKRAKSAPAAVRQGAWCGREGAGVGSGHLSGRSNHRCCSRRVRCEVAAGDCGLAVCCILFAYANEGKADPKISEAFAQRGELLLLVKQSREALQNAKALERGKVRQRRKAQAGAGSRRLPTPVPVQSFPV